MERGVTMQTFLKQRDWMGSVRSDMQTREQYRHFVRGHQRRRRWYERLCRRFGDLTSQICQYCQFVNIVSRPRWLNNLKYCWLNINLPYEHIGARGKISKTEIQKGSIQSECTGNPIQRFTWKHRSEEETQVKDLHESKDPKRSSNMGQWFKMQLGG